MQVVIFFSFGGHAAEDVKNNACILINTQEHLYKNNNKEKKGQPHRNHKIKNPTKKIGNGGGGWVSSSVCQWPVPVVVVKLLKCVIV